MTLGLIHGSAPHAFVLCHKAGTTEIEGYPGHTPAVVARARRATRADRAARRPAPRPAKVEAIALNTRDLAEEEARAAIADAEAATGLPADDPVRFGAAKLADTLLASRSSL